MAFTPRQRIEKVQTAAEKAEQWAIDQEARGHMDDMEPDDDDRPFDTREESRGER